MQIPNLLNMAMSIVGVQQFEYSRFLRRITNSVGLDESKYDAPEILSGQVQAVPRNLFDAYGLDFQRNYVVFYISKDILDIGRDVSGDKIEFGGKIYQCLSETDWFQINGWTGILSVQVQY